MRGRSAVAATVAVLVSMLAGAPIARAAPCVQACADEVAACRSAQCEGLTKKALRHCRHACKRSIVRDCFQDLAVCGATSARPPKATGGGGGGGGGTSGGW